MSCITICYWMIFTFRKSSSSSISIAFFFTKVTFVCFVVMLFDNIGSDLIDVIQLFFIGIVMFTVLPRQMFGLVQSKLFPKYFLCGTFCSSIALATYVGHHPIQHWQGDYRVKVNNFLLGWLSTKNDYQYLDLEALKTCSLC